MTVSTPSRRGRGRLPPPGDSRTDVSRASPSRKAEPLPLNAALKVRLENSRWWPKRKSQPGRGPHPRAVLSGRRQPRAAVSRAVVVAAGPSGAWAWSPDPSRAGVGRHRYLEPQSKAAVLGDEDRSGRDAAGGKKGDRLEGARGTRAQTFATRFMETAPGK